MKCRYCGSPVTNNREKCSFCGATDDFILQEQRVQKADCATFDTFDAQKEADDTQAQQQAGCDTEITAGNAQAQTEEVNETEDEEKEAANEGNSLVFGLGKKEFYDHYVPNRVRAGVQAGIYLLFISAAVTVLTGLLDFYMGIGIAVACLALAIIIRRTLSIAPAIIACVFTTMITVLNLILNSNLNGWIPTVSSVICCFALYKFNSMWIIYKATAAVPILYPTDIIRSQNRRIKRKSKVVLWILYYLVLILCLVGVTVNYAAKLSYVAIFEKGVTEKNYYSNDFYDIKIIFDSSKWYVYTEEDLRIENSYVYNYPLVYYPEDTEGQILFANYRNDGARIRIRSGYLDSMFANEEEYAKGILASWRQEPGVVEASEGGDFTHRSNTYKTLDFKCREMTEDGREANYVHRVYINVYGSYCVIIEVFAATEGSLSTIEKASFVEN